MTLQEHTLTTYYFDPASKSFKRKSTTKRIGYNDVLIRTTHSGVCFTDVHAKNSKPCGLGHEGVGIVAEVGAGVRHLKVGQRVGWGWLHSSCGHCCTCVTGYRQYCSEARGFAFADLDQGAFSDFRIIDADFAYPIPDRISSVNAAPLMCAGASVFEALDAAGTKSNDRVGVVGIGGLGHMAILFAKAMGCTVTAISSDMTKREDAFKLGADEFRCTQPPKTGHVQNHGRIETCPQNINVLLITSNAVPELKDIFPMLARRAKIVLMTIQQDSLNVPYMSFVLPGHHIIASTEASQENHIKMLEFADRHKIQPWIQTFDMDAQGLTEAFSLLEKGRLKYRGVLIQKDAGRF